MKNVPCIAIIGQTNVGKSTLFNALSKQKKSIVTDVSHTTRDFYKAFVSYSKRSFSLIDTGGWSKDKTFLTEKINQNNEKIIQNSDWLFWVVDFEKPMDENDFYIHQKIKLYKKKTILIINKAEKFHHLDQIQPFLKLGIKTQIPLAAKNQLYFNDLFNWIKKNIPVTPLEFIDQKTFKILLLGQPNVGKSSLFNALSKQQKSIVYNQPHTTTNLVEISISHKDCFLHFFDSAGMRRKKQKAELIEKKAFKQMSKEIMDVDLILLVCDISQELMVQDKKIVGLILDYDKKFIIVGNKWDLTRTNDMQLKKYITNFFPFCKNNLIDIVLTSSLQNTSKKSINSIKTLLNVISTTLSL